MLPLFVVTIALALFLVWQTGHLRFAVVPVGVLALWVMLRIQTPRVGMPVTSIRSTPGAVVMLSVLAGAIALFGILLAVDIYIFKHPFRDPLEPYHALLFAPPFIVLFAGVFRADRLQKSERDRDA